MLDSIIQVFSILTDFLLLLSINERKVLTSIIVDSFLSSNQAYSWILNFCPLWQTLLISMFWSITFSVIIDRVGLKSTVLLVLFHLFCLFCVLPHPTFQLAYRWSISYHFIYLHDCSFIPLRNIFLAITVGFMKFFLNSHGLPSCVG